VIAAALEVASAGHLSESLGGALGMALAVALGFWALMRLSAMARAGGRQGRLAKG
jgi:hypothetical protein